MPIYEYYSADTHTVYQFYARSLSYRDSIPRCPDGEKYRMQKKVSSFAFIGKIDFEEPEGDGIHDAEDMFDESQLAQAMSKMEREFSRMDPDNPDPKALGKMMREMASVTGEKMPEDMQEMIGRMEAGEDLESIENRFGDLMEGDGDDDGELEADQLEKRSPTAAAALKLLRRQRSPKKDPELYEITDYL
ncbi:MAG: cytochrome C [Opitutales bacterium]|nr:cytochrome C [Opitutales bacterium]